MTLLKNFRLVELPAVAEWRLFSLLTAAFVVSVPFVAGVNSVIAICLLLSWLLFVPKSFRLMREVMALSAVFLLAILGMLLTANEDEGWFRVQQKTLLFIVPLVFLTADVDRKKLSRLALSLFVLGIAAACIRCLGDAIIFWARSGNSTRFTSHGLVYAINLYPYILALCCVLCQLILVEAKRGGVEVFGWMNSGVIGWLMVFFFAAFVFLLSVQQVLLIWLFCAAVLLVRHVRSNYLRISGVVAVGLITLLAVFIIQPLREKVIDLFLKSSENTIPLDDEAPWNNEWNGISIRKAIWTCSWDVVKKSPWIGVGTGDMQDELQVSYANRKFYLAALYNRYNAHNQYIQTAIGFGIAGLVLWLIGISWTIKRFGNNFLFVVALVSVCLSMLTESLLETNKGNLVMAVVCSVFLLHCLPNKEKA